MFTVSGNKPGDSTALQVQVPCIVFFVLTPIFVFTRSWSRIQSGIGHGVDDWTILVSFTFALIVSALMMASCAYGFGQHVFNLSHHNKIMTLKLFYVAQAFYKLTINLTKASILLLYLRIFVQKYFRVLCYIMLAIVLSYMIATFIAAIFQCTPLPRAWDKSIPGTCINITENWYANAGFSIATDFIILVLPMPILYKLSLPPNQRAALMFVFALGGFVMVTSILRMQTLNLSSTSPDSTYEITSSLWTIVEENIGIICACLPMARLPLSILFPSVFPPKKSNDTYASTTRSANGAFIRAGTGKNEWIPSRGGGKDERAINLTNVKANGVNGFNDNSSEEYILPSHQSSGNGEGQAIHKVTDFAVTYEDGIGRKESVSSAVPKSSPTAKIV